MNHYDEFRKRFAGFQDQSDEYIQKNFTTIAGLLKEISFILEENDRLTEKVKELQEHVSKDDIARLKWEHLIAQGEALGIVVTEEKQANGITRITSRNARAEKAEALLDVHGGND